MKKTNLAIKDIRLGMNQVKENTVKKISEIGQENASKIIGCSQPFISNYVNGKRVTYNKVLEIAEKLGL